MTLYIYDQPDWPKFRWNHESLDKGPAAVRHKQGRLLGRMEGLGFKFQQEAVLKTLTEDVLKTTEIEGERLDADQVRSSIARRLGMDIGGLKPVDHNVEGIVEMMLDATRQYDQPLTTERLFSWHASLFPTGRSGMTRIRVGAWRDDSTGPMQVVSGPVGRERVHFEAPAAARLDREIQLFLDSFCCETPEVGVRRRYFAAFRGPTEAWSVSQGDRSGAARGSGVTTGPVQRHVAARWGGDV